jgi:hypothetical protein
MPADADLLCEYYLASNLNHKSSSVSRSNCSPLLVNSSLFDKNKMDSKLKQIKSINNSFNGDTISSTASSLLLSDSIDFVKYDKNPMDILKKKYHLLNTSSSETPNSSSELKTPIIKEDCNKIALPPPQVSSNQCQMFKSSEWLDLNWCKVRKNGIGLYNLGNNCYLNATLQCLAYTPSLSQWLTTKPHSPTCKIRSRAGGSNQSFCSLCEVERIVYDIFNSFNGCAKPNSLCFNIKSNFLEESSYLKFIMFNLYF